MSVMLTIFPPSLRKGQTLIEMLNVLKCIIGKLKLDLAFNNVKDRYFVLDKVYVRIEHRIGMCKTNKF